MNSRIVFALLTGVVSAVAAVAGELHRRERSLEQRYQQHLGRNGEVRVDLPEHQRVDLAYRKKLSPAETDLVVWLS